MFDINFSMYGMFSIIILMLVSIISIYIVGMNIKYKNQDIKTTIESNSVKFSKAIVNAEGIKVEYKIAKNNWWTPMFDEVNKSVYVPIESFNSSSLYNQVNTLFKTMLLSSFVKSGKKYKGLSMASKVILTILVVNLFWMSAMSLWIGVIAIYAIIAIMFISELAYGQKLINESSRKTKEFLTEGLSPQEVKTFKEYIKYKNIFILTKYLSMFFSPFVSGFVAFKKWGVDE